MGKNMSLYYNLNGGCWETCVVGFVCVPLSCLFLGSLYYHIFLEDSIQLSLTQTIDSMPCTTDFQKRTISCYYDLLPRTIISLLRFHSPFHSSKVMFIHCTLFTLMAVFQVVSIPLPLKY